MYQVLIGISVCFTLSVHRETGPGAAEVHDITFSVSEKDGDHLHPQAAHREGAAEGV